jgi:hypothetical protein
MILPYFKQHLGTLAEFKHFTPQNATNSDVITGFVIYRPTQTTLKGGQR